MRVGEKCSGILIYLSAKRLLHKLPELPVMGSKVGALIALKIITICAGISLMKRAKDVPVFLVITKG